MLFVKNQIPSSPTMKQGIVAVLGSEPISDKHAAAASIRRTLSADMSSKNWAHQNGFPSPLKYSPPSPSSSEEFHRTPCDRDDVWRSIQKNNNPETAKAISWDSILSRKKETPLLPAPYVRRSLSGLSDESLEICTERLGSESGSECFSSSDCSTECLTEAYLAKEQGRARERADRRKASPPARPLPPPLPSISGGRDAGGWASQFRMQSRRENGRLIVEVVSASPGNYFEARRGDGRLVLTMVRGGGSTEVFEDTAEEVVDDGGGEMKKLSVFKKGLAMKKFEAIGNTNAAWSNKAEIPMVARMISPPSGTGATTFNAYKYFWRTKTTVSSGFVNPVITTPEAINNKNCDDDNDDKNNNNVVYKNQNMVMVKGSKGEVLVPYSKGCKVARRSLMFWEPYCIATS